MASIRGHRAGEARASERRRPFLEIQYHPGDIRRGVRYLFLTRRQVFAWSMAGAFYLAFLLFSLVITPTVVRNSLDEKKYEELQGQRTHEGDRLKDLVGRMAALTGDSAQALIEMSKIHLAYGLANESRGQGGYPSSRQGSPGGETRSIYRQEIQRGSELHGKIEEQVEALRVRLEEVQAFESANQDQVATTPSLSPLRSDSFVMTSPFGTRRSPFTKEIDFHPGIDLAATIGTPIHAPAEGTVTFAGRFPLRQSVAWWRYGNLVAVRNGERFMTLYGHCEEIRVKVGQRVRQGDVVATVGNTGWSTNPHLHYEVRWRDEGGDWHPVDPRIYILDHRWRDEERMLIQARKAPNSQDYEPLPRVIGR